MAAISSVPSVGSTNTGGEEVPKWKCCWLGWRAGLKSRGGQAGAGRDESRRRGKEEAISGKALWERPSLAVPKGQGQKRDGPLCWSSAGASAH